MNSKEKLPTPKDLLPTPQLAVLSMLENTLEMVLRMLFAQHPDLYDHEKRFIRLKRTLSHEEQGF